MSAVEWVEFGTVKMDVPGCIGAVDLTALLARRGGTRGMDVPIESIDGERAAGRKRAAWLILLEFRVFGKVDFDGDPHSDVRLGLRDNIGYLEDTIVAPYTSSKTIKMVHHFSDDEEWEADVIVEDLLVSPINPGIGTAADVALTVAIPSGRLTEVTS